MLSLLCGLIWLIICFLILYGTWKTRQHFRSESKQKEKTTTIHPISILKPLCGIDNGLEENLKGFFQLDYPQFELLFSVANKNDPVCGLVQKLIDEFPTIPARLMIAKPVQKQMNPTIHNLLDIYDAAKYDWLLKIDSNARITPSYLHDLNAQIQPNTGLISSVVTVTGIQDLPGWLESGMLANVFARFMVLSYTCNIPCTMGKSMLFRRSLTNQFGGLLSLSSSFVDDAELGQAIHQLGYQIVLSNKPVNQFLGGYSWLQFFNRHVRWSRMRRKYAPLAAVCEPLTCSWVSGFFGAYFFYTYFNISFFCVLLLHQVCWFICDVVVQKSLNLHLDWRTNMFTWFLRELVSIPLWIYAACGNTVNWNGTILEIY